MKITNKQIDKLLAKTDLNQRTFHELRIILCAVVNEHYNRGFDIDLKTIVELNRDCIVGEN